MTQNGWGESLMPNCTAQIAFTVLDGRPENRASGKVLRYIDAGEKFDLALLSPKVAALMVERQEIACTAAD